MVSLKNKLQKITAPVRETTEPIITEQEIVETENIASEQEVVDNDITEEIKQSSRSFIAVIVILALLAIGGVVFFFLKR